MASGNLLTLNGLNVAGLKFMCFSVESIIHNSWICVRMTWFPSCAKEEHILEYMASYLAIPEEAVPPPLRRFVSQAGDFWSTSWQIIHAMFWCFPDGRFWALGSKFNLLLDQGDHGQSALHPWNFGSAAARWESEGGVVYLKLGESLDQQLNGQWFVGKERAIKNYGYEGMEGWFSGSAKGFDLLWNKFNSNGRGSQKINPHEDIFS